MIRSVSKLSLTFLLLLLLGSSFPLVISQESPVLSPAWEYIAPELTYITLDGGLAQWSALNPVDIELVDMSLTGEEYQIQAYFGFNVSKLFIGLLIPKGEQVVNGVEIIFFGEGVYDGIIVDSVLEEARDVTYVNHTYVAYDSDLGGREDVKVVISDEGDDDFYMIVKETRFPEGDLEGNWVFDEGDSVAVVIQAWVDKIKDDVNRPNFSTAVDGFSFLRLSIKEDNGWLQVPLLPWDLMWEESDLPEVSYHERDVDLTLDGKKDEDFWFHASTSTTELFLISKTNTSSILHSAAPAKKNITFSFVHDKEYLYMYLEILHENADSYLEELILVFGNEVHALNNLSAPLLLVKINPTNGSFVRSGINAELRVPGFVPTISPDSIHMVSTVSTYDIQDLEYATFRDFGPHDVESVEVQIPVFGTASGGIIPLVSSDVPDYICVLDLTMKVTEEDPVAPYSNPWSAVTLEDEQLYFNVYKLELSEETYETTKTDSFIIVTVLFLLPCVWINTIRKRKLRE